MELERRFCSDHHLQLAARAEGSGQLITGYAAVFNTLSVELWGFREKIAPGAFTASLGDDVRALWNHDTGVVMGRTRSGTLRLAEDATGLRIENEPPAAAAHQIESIGRGDVDQMSFGFRTLEDTWDEDEDGQLIRTLRKVKLYEVSFVTFPAYPATSVQLRAEGATVDQAWGLIPTIPTELRRASDSHIADPAKRALAQRARLRQLQILALE
jgi:HK97 family phage prohead protease